MSGWSEHSGLVVTLPMDNIDTDQLIPARFMSTPRNEGYGQFLLHDLTADIADLDGASILIAGRNFGCGSSREAAVYALVDFGIRAVIAPGFGDIFATNAVNNGLLPARMEEGQIETLIRDGASEAHVDLERLTVQIGSASAGFELDPVAQKKLLNGWDDIDLTAQHADAIAAFREVYVKTSPWAGATISGRGADQNAR